jgi:endonuclease/exonuclease/phosphatase (EEP) superfamily protein YafD
MLLITALQVLPWYVGSADAPTAAGSRIMMVNVWTQNPQRHRVAAAIRDADPDIVVLLEVSESWLAELNLGASCPYVHEEPRSDNFGIALYSPAAVAAPAYGIPWLDGADDRGAGRC